MTWKTLLNRSSHSFTIRMHRNLIANEPEKWPVMVLYILHLLFVLELVFWKMCDLVETDLVDYLNYLLSG